MLQLSNEIIKLLRAIAAVFESDVNFSFHLDSNQIVMKKKKLTEYDSVTIT